MSGPRVAWAAALAVFMVGMAPASAQVAAPAAATAVQTPAQAWAMDAGVYARRFGVGEEEAARRLRALHASAALTDRIRATFRHRLAGISIEHAPALRIVVLLTGDAAVTATGFAAEGLVIPIEFRTGAPASADQVARAMIERGPGLKRLLPRARGMGLDPRTGELVILLPAADAGRRDLPAIRASAEALTGVKIRFERTGGPITDLALPADETRPDGPLLAGGGRIVGLDPADGKRYACTTGFVVGDGARSGLATAAHCPDTVDYIAADGGRTPLTFVGQWGVSTQDVQVHVAPGAGQPLFYADRKGGALRKVGGERSRQSTRGGEWLCRYGESSGYSCAEVELTHFAPPAPLCAGTCAPTWITVRTEQCASGDSGGPVFSGPIAFGINKGGSRVGATCNFYFYMSVDFLPAGWRVMR